MKKLLRLDDYRNPNKLIHANRLPKIIDRNKDKIIRVMNYDEFIEAIQNSIPDFISFDHDLADEHYTPKEYRDDYEASKAYQEAQIYTEKT